MSNSGRRRWEWLVLLGLVGCARGEAVWADATLPLRRVVIYRNGVGYFERQGRVAGERVEFRVRRAEVGDFLATLAVRGRGGNSVVSAAFPMPGEGGSGGGDDRSTVRLQLDGRGRDLSVGYMTETPIWRPSYRLLFTPRGVDLQVWGIVQNRSGADWTNVRLALVSGAPVAFRSDLAEATVTPRPVVNDRGEVIESVPPAETTLGYEDRDGHEDRDHDRVLDATDRCPDEPETYNGIEDVDGCPDQGRLVVEESRIQILETIAFARDSAAPTARATPLLEAVARAMASNPQVLRVAVEGHADAGEARGAASGQQALSDRRAAAVVAYLVAHGVASSRLEARGYGDARPRAAGRDEATQARNRRVEFHVLQTRDGSVTTDSGRPPPPAPASPPPPRNSAQMAALASRGGTSRFELRVPVTIPNQSAAMVMLAVRTVPGERMFLFAPNAGVPASATHPFEVARFENRTGALLERGPVAIFDEGAFLGQGLLEPLPEGATTAVPFALERAIDVESAATDGVEGERLVRVVRGQITLERYRVARTTYRVRNGFDRAVRVVLRHGVADGAQVHAPPSGTEEAPGVALVPARVAARGRGATVVQTRAPFAVHADWTDEPAERAIEAYLRDPRVPAATATALRAALGFRRQILDAARDRAALDERRTDLARAADETRRNLAAVERAQRAADLRAQLAARLAQTSAQVAETDRRLVEADERASEARARLAEVVRPIDLDTATATAAPTSRPAP